jgi:hypothetical protein
MVLEGVEKKFRWLSGGGGGGVGSLTRWYYIIMCEFFIITREYRGGCGCMVVVGPFVDPRYEAPG